ncbi:MAG: class I poly(R)-hydroxyalkanoic acid synthase, partial [Candidatus Competibacteraceae bacterium]|nr:class I poly(R)-hydroxyalkanoic acid synthase [Candidatus Competibacteraceae bacterium]
MADPKEDIFRINPPDLRRLNANLPRIAQQSQRLLQDWLERQARGDFFTIPDPGIVARTFFELNQRLMADPGRLIEAQLRFWQGYLQVVNTTTQRLWGQETQPAIKPAADDKRFKDDDWARNAVFDYLKQSYLLAAHTLQDTVSGVEGLDPKTAARVDFYTRQFIDALSPTNFALTNPKVLRHTLECGGENLVQGLANLLDDLERGKGQLRIRMTDQQAFRLGENIAATPGKVIFQDELLQLIQYTPTTQQVYQRPLLIVPPWINKFYILDLRPKNSFIQWAVNQGFTVFVISWVNPDARLAEKDFEDYLSAGTLAALEAIEQATDEREVNAVGYCLGGTLLMSTVAWLAARGEQRIQSATCFTTMTDFADVGELEVFIDEEQLQGIERHMEEKGYLEGAHMAQVFNMLRANDLIWSFVINNYLMGRDPMAFDLLYWNSDSTRMPRRMHSFYLRNMYQHNRLSTPGGITLAGEAIDLGQVKVPVYFLSTRE